MKKKLISRKWFKLGFEVREELCSMEQDALIETKLKSAYSPDGYYLGNPVTAHYLCKKGISYFAPAKEGNRVCSIGFNLKEGKWVGWSHRVICSFGLGDRIFEEKYGNDRTPFKKHGKKTIKTLAEAKLAAIKFAESVF